MTSYYESMLLICVAVFCFKISSAESLYNSNDHVVVLNGDSILSNLSKSSKLWLVNFYLDWCAHCQEFASVYKALARDIKDWRRFIKIGAINCGDAAPSGDENSLTCHQDPFSINDYPELRIFLTDSNSSNGGTPFEIIVSLQEMRQKIVHLIEENFETFPGNFKPDLTPVSSDFLMKNVYTIPRITSRHKYLALVFEDESSRMGKEIILDMSSSKYTLVRRVVSRSEIKMFMKVYKITSDLPFVALLISGRIPPKLLDVLFKTRYFYVYQLRLLVGEPGLELEEPRVTPNYSLLALPRFIDPNRNRVFLADIESGLRYMLVSEVAASKTLSGRKLEALKKMIRLLLTTAFYFPHRKSTILFLQELDNWMAARTSITSREWLKKIKEKQPDKYLPPSNRLWVGCKSNEDDSRGFPCSLWTIFHALSVATYKAKLDTQLVPHAIEGYIANFFSCRECRTNFKKEIKLLPFRQTNSNYDAILWLWEIHNMINKRLSRTSLSKEQFPTKDLCSHCFVQATGRWSKFVVAKYLIHHFSTENVSMKYLENISALNRQDEEFGKGTFFSNFGKRLFHPRGLGSNIGRNYKTEKHVSDKDTAIDEMLPVFLLFFIGLCLLVVLRFFVRFNCVILRKLKLY